MRQKCVRVQQLPNVLLLLLQERAVHHEDHAMVVRSKHRVRS